METLETCNVLLINDRMKEIWMLNGCGHYGDEEEWGNKEEKFKIK